MKTRDYPEIAPYNRALRSLGFEMLIASGQARAKARDYHCYAG
jgi:hypothetical protein